MKTLTFFSLIIWNVLMSNIGIADNNSYGTLTEPKSSVFTACPGVAPGECNVIAPGGNMPEPGRVDN